MLVRAWVWVMVAGQVAWARRWRGSSVYSAGPAAAAAAPTAAWVAATNHSQVDSP